VVEPATVAAYPRHAGGIAQRRSIELRNVGPIARRCRRSGTGVNRTAMAPIQEITTGRSAVSAGPAPRSLLRMPPRDAHGDRSSGRH
jgi:hypothetical protein